MRRGRGDVQMSRRRQGQDVAAMPTSGREVVSARGGVLVGARREVQRRDCRPTPSSSVCHPSETGPPPSPPFLSIARCHRASIATTPSAVGRPSEGEHGEEGAATVCERRMRGEGRPPEKVEGEEEERKR